MIDSFIGLLLVSRSRLVEEDAVEEFHYYGFHLSSSFLMYNFKCTKFYRITLMSPSSLVKSLNYT